MTEFWEEAFKEKREMWGFEPAKSAIIAMNFFNENNVKEILIPGIGYGRNAKVFIDQGINVTGIEISKTAIDIAQKHFGNEMTIYQGSVTDMPFDKKLYDGIFCYALIHLLSKEERIKLIQDCYNQLTNTGVMIFTSITKDAKTFGEGTLISENRYEMFGGVKMFFYDKESIHEEFANAGIVDISEVSENYPFYFIICKKKVNYV